MKQSGNVTNNCIIEGYKVNNFIEVERLSGLLREGVCQQMGPVSTLFR